MSILTKGDQLVFLTSLVAADMLLTTFNPATYQDVVTNDPTVATKLRINGYAEFVKAQLVDSIRAERPRPAAKEKITIDSANAAQIALGAGNEGKVIRFIIGTRLLHGANVEFYTANWDGFRKHNYVAIKVKAGDTTATILERVASTINYQASVDQGEFPFKATFAGGVFSLEAKSADYILKLAAEDRVDIPSTVLTAFAPVKAVEQFEGVGQYENLMTYRLETPARNEEYSIQQYDGVNKGSGYTKLQFFTNTPRPDLASNEAADSYSTTKNTFTLQVARGNEAGLTTLLNFLNGAPAGVDKVFTGSDGTAKSLANFLLDV
jgi:hypothetical protein